MYRAVLALLVFAGCVWAQRLIGPKGFSPESDRRLAASDFNYVLSTPIQLLYLEAPAVRNELKLTREQAAKIDALRKQWDDGAAEIDLERGASVNGVPDLFIQSRKALGEILNGDQMRRLNQVIVRHREKEYGRPAVLAMLQSDLKLTAQQQERFDVLRRKRAETVLEHLTSGDRAPTIRRSVHEANNEFVESVEKLLTKEQSERLADLFGAPFGDDLKLQFPQSISMGGVAERSVYLERLWQRYGLEAEILNNESVHKELKLTNDEVRKVKEFNVEWWARYEVRRRDGDSETDAVFHLHKYVSGELGKLLTEAQIRRLAQIAMQLRKKVAGEHAAFGHPDVPLHLLTENLASRVRTGEPLEEIMGSETLSMFRKSLGEPFQGELKINSPLRIKQPVTVLKPNAIRPLIETNRLTLARFMLGNERRYRLDEDQVARLKAIDEDLPILRKLLHRELSQLPPPTDAGAARNIIPETRAVEHFRKAIFEQCFDVLDKKQQSLWGDEIRRARATIIDY